MAGMTNNYGDDLAYIHDAGFGDLARNAAPLLVEALHRRGIADGLVIDLGCGSGLLARGMSKSGYDVLGIDISPAMIALARERVPEGRFLVGSLLSTELPSCVGVAAVGEGFNYLFDRSNTKHRLSRLLRRIYKALDPKGVLIFDVAAPGRVPEGGPRRSYVEGKDWAVLVTAEEDRRRRLLTRRITSFRRVGELYRRDQETHRLRLLSRSEVASELRGLGFRARILSGYGPLKFVPGHVGFLAGKP
jgi:SAM-dependent methyltransferase